MEAMTVEVPIRCFSPESGFGMAAGYLELY